MISPGTKIKDVIASHPATREVFARHGLDACCGGAHPVEVAARAHKVDLEPLLAELGEVIAAGPPAEPPPAPVPPEDVYAPFIKGAIVATLTGGATLGLVALTIAGLRGSLETGLGWWTPVIQAHGHVQIFGWVALFIMGVAYHVVPRFKATELHRPRLARLTFWLMSAGLVARALAQPFMYESFAAAVGFAGSLAELAAVGLFAWILRRTLASSAAPVAVFEDYLLAGTGWFLVLAGANVATMARMAWTSETVIPDSWNAALLHVQVVGFVGLWILGVSLRILPVFLGLRPLSARLASAVFWAVNVAVVLRAAAELGDLPALEAPGAVLELLAVSAFVLGLGLFRRGVPPPHADPNPYYRKFIRAAYAWLLFAAALLVFITVFEAVAGRALPPELTGSYRHAITVGFITAMIMGVASRILPVFRGVPLQGVGALDAAFWMLNAGCAIRVFVQGLAGFWGGPLTLISATSAYLEIPAIALFSVVIWRTLGAQPGLKEGRGEITLASRVGAVLSRYPELLAVFLRHGRPGRVALRVVH